MRRVKVCSEYSVDVHFAVANGDCLPDIFLPEGVVFIASASTAHFARAGNHGWIQLRWIGTLPIVGTM
jgi:hypothetical protein